MRRTHGALFAIACGLLVFVAFMNREPAKPAATVPGVDPRPSGTMPAARPLRGKVESGSAPQAQNPRPAPSGKKKGWGPAEQATLERQAVLTRFSPMRFGSLAESLLIRWHREGGGNLQHVALRTLETIEHADTNEFIKCALIRCLPYFIHWAPDAAREARLKLVQALRGEYGSLGTLAAIGCVSGEAIEIAGIDGLTGYSYLELEPVDARVAQHNPFKSRLAAEQVGDDVRDLIRHFLNHENYTLLSGAVRALGVIKDEDAGDEVWKLYNRNDLAPRRHRFLGYFEQFPEDGVQRRRLEQAAFEQTREDKDRADALEVLGRMQAWWDSGRVRIERAATDRREPELVRAVAKELLLSKLLAESREDQIRAYLTHSDPVLRQEFLSAVVVLREAKLDKLAQEALVGDRDPKIRKKLQDLEFGRRAQPMRPRDDILEGLRARLQNPFMPEDERARLQREVADREKKR